MILYLSATSNSNLSLAQELKEIGETLGGEHEVVDLAGLDLPLFSSLNEKEEPPAAAVALFAKIQKASAFVITAPEYNGSLPPAFNNAISWVSKCDKDFREGFNGKFSAIATHSGGPGQKVLGALRGQLEYLGTTVLARQISTNYSKKLDPETGKSVLQQLLAASK